jgi:hypothetical protein
MPENPLSRADRLAILISLLGVLAAYVVTVRVYEGMAHIEDEMAYVWQAQAIAEGHLKIASPPQAKSFLVPFVIDYQGERFGKYPLGWPVVLAVGVFLGARSLVNPLLAGLGVWLTYRLGKKTLGETVGLLAAGLTVISPFFLMNSGSLLSHPLGLVLSLAFVLGWLDGWQPEVNLFGEVNSSRRWIPILASAFSLGILALTRPLTAVGVSLPFAFHGLYLMIRGGDPQDRWIIRRRLIIFGLLVILLSLLTFLWQYALTGDPLLNPYTLWWKYDTVGFGPGIGRLQGGHTPHQGWINTRHSLWAGRYDLFGWGRYSWIFMPIGLLAALRERKSLLPIAVLPSLVLVYMAYWIGSTLFGPRYYYEGLFSAILLSAAGIALLAGWPTRPGQEWRSYSGWRKAQPLLMTAILAVLVTVTLGFFAPRRVGNMHGLYEVTRARLEPFQTPEAQELTPALVIVHPDTWSEYGALLELEDPDLDTPFIFAYTRGSTGDAALAKEFPQRTVIHYYTNKPNSFYVSRPPLVKKGN